MVLAPVHSFRAEAQPHVVGPELQNKAISVLRTAMKEGAAFEKVHAAEALIWTGHPEGIEEYYREEDRTASSEFSYRIGIWRVLYRFNAGNPAGQQEYLARILAVFSDPKAQDQATAAETLGKLKYAGADCTKLVLDLAEHGKDDLRVWARWILANSGKIEDEAHLAKFLCSKSPPDRANAAYAFRYCKTILPATLKAIEDLAATEPADGEVRYYVLGTLYTHLPADQRESAKRELLRYAVAGNTDQRYQACMALANWPTEDMIQVVEKLLGNKPVDERVGAAYVLLRMGQPRDKVDPNH
ncbi:MAG: hypothetical protein WC935_10070 [Thermoleophilia bacterium]